MTVTYESQVIARFAERLYGQARVTTWLFAVLGFLSGGAVGLGANVGLDIHSDASPLVFWTSAIVGGLFGLALGSERAFSLRLRAQLALCQLQIEFNTRRMPSEGNR